MDQKGLVYLKKSEGVSGPFTLEEVLLMHERNEIGVATLLSEEEKSEWLPLASFAPNETIEVAIRRDRAVSRNRVRLVTLICTFCVAASVAIAAISHSKNASVLLKRADSDRVLKEFQAILEAKSSELAETKRRMDEMSVAESARGAVRDRLSDKINALTGELSVKDARIQLLEDVAREYAVDFASYRSSIFNVAQIPEKAVLKVNITKDGPLNFDEEVVESIVENELGRSGFIVVEEDDSNDDKLYVFASIGQLKIGDGLQSIFNFSLRCFGKCLRGEDIRAFEIFEENDFGYAGTKSNYKTIAKEFFSDSVVKCIAKINEARAESDGEKQVENTLDRLLKASIPLSKSEKKVEAELVGSASGVLIGSRPLILTNHHVISKGKTIQLHFDSGISLEGVVLGSNETVDLAVLTTKEQTNLGEGDVFASFCDSAKLLIGAEVYSLGFPMARVLGLELKYSSGSVSSTKGMRDQVNQFQHSIPTQPGNSGGPVFFKSGELAGLIVATLNPLQDSASGTTIPQNVNYAIRSDTIVDFLEENRLWEEVKMESRKPLPLESAKKHAVRIEVFK
jgi:S1-C subfamily serine protease